MANKKILDINGTEQVVSRIKNVNNQLTVLGDLNHAKIVSSVPSNPTPGIFYHITPTLTPLRIDTSGINIGVVVAHPSYENYMSVVDLISIPQVLSMGYVPIGLDVYGGLTGSDYGFMALRYWDCNDDTGVNYPEKIDLDKSYYGDVMSCYGGGVDPELFIPLKGGTNSGIYVVPSDIMDKSAVLEYTNYNIMAPVITDGAVNDQFIQGAMGYWNPETCDPYKNTFNLLRLEQYRIPNVDWITERAYIPTPYEMTFVIALRMNIAFMITSLNQIVYEFGNCGYDENSPYATPDLPRQWIPTTGSSGPGLITSGIYNYSNNHHSENPFVSFGRTVEGWPAYFDWTPPTDGGICLPFIRYADTVQRGGGVFVV